MPTLNDYDDHDDACCSDDLGSILGSISAEVAAANLERICDARGALSRLRQEWVVRGTWTVSDANGYETLHVAAQHKTHASLRHFRYNNNGGYWQQASDATRTNTWVRLDR
jgi:hypothetical protein